MKLRNYEKSTKYESKFGVKFKSNNFYFLKVPLNNNNIIHIINICNLKQKYLCK